MRVTISKIIYPGKSLASTSAKTILTDEGIPQEVVDVESTAEKKNYIKAKTVRIITPSLSRIKPRCVHYQACSPYQYIDYSVQIAIKQSQLKEILTPLLPEKSTSIPMRPSPKIWGYRNKARFNVIWDKNLPRPAYNAPHSRDRFIPIDRCYLISEPANILLGELLKIIKENKLNFIAEVEIKESRYKNNMLVILHCNASRIPDNISNIIMPITKIFPISGVVCLTHHGKVVRQHLILGNDYIEESICGKSFFIGAQSFFQVNIKLLEKLIQDMSFYLSLNGNETIADLYCGVGTFAITLADRANKILGVENSAENIYFFKKSMEFNKIKNLSIYKGACQTLLPRILEKNNLDILIIDPPRKGLDPSMLRHILLKPMQEIVYLSCNPSTLARDLAILNQKYTFTNIIAYDFFPHTPHIETLVLMQKK